MTYSTAKPKRILILDTETTGLDPSQDELLQVGIISDDGRILYNRYLKPTKNQSWPEAELVNRISPAMVANSPTIEDERSTIGEILATADIILGYNISFDLSFLQAADIQIPSWTDDPPLCIYEDVMDRFAPIFGEWSSRHGNYRWQSLSTAARWYGYCWPDGEAHNAITDSLATLHVWKAMQNNGDWDRALDIIREANLNPL